MSKAATATKPRERGILPYLRRANPDLVQAAREAAPKRGAGPEVAIDPFMVAEAAGMIKQGATDLEVCDAIGVSHATFYRWVAQVPGFAELLQAPKQTANSRVEQAMFRRALGGVKRTVTIGPDGAKTERVEELPGDARAQGLWLMNKDKLNWKPPRAEHELIVPMGDDVPALPPEEQDVRKLALAAIALMREAGDAAPLIEQAGTEPVPADVSYDDEDEEIDDEEQDEDFDI